MGCAASSSTNVSPYKQEKNWAESRLEKNIADLRSKVRNKESLEFSNRIIFVLYGPPDSPTKRSAEYIAGKVNLPVLYPDQFIFNRDQHGSLERLSTTPHILNVSSRHLRRMTSSVVVDSTRQALLKISEEDQYRRGWVMYEYPDTASELRYFIKEQFKNVQVSLFFMEMDSETLALQLDRWDRYVDPLSKSSVHLRDTALPVKGVKGQARNEELIVEDFDEDEVCGEDLQQATTDEPDQPLLTSKDNLVKLKEDTVEAYKERLAKFEMRKIPIFYDNEDISYVIPGGSRTDVERELLRSIYKIHENNLREDYEKAILPTASSDD